MINFPYSHKKIGLAVSGGADSAAMLHMAAMKKTPDRFIAFTINHGLRPESSREVISVQKTAQDYGFECVILTLSNLSKKSAVQEKARDARYQILAKAAKDHECDMICIAHHKNDIMETLLSRLAHHSGLMGLAVMPPFFYHLGTFFHRPMLHLSRQEIEDYTDKYKLDILHDPSNENMQYERVRHRDTLKNNPDLQNPLMTLHAKAKALKYNLTFERDLFIQKYVSLSPFGFCVIDHPAFSGLDDLTAQAVLKYAIHYVGGRQYVTLTKRPVKNMTLGGCYVHMNKRTVSVFREKRNLSEIQSQSGQIIYDNRFLLTLPEAGIIAIATQKDYNIPFFAAESLPVLKGNSGKIYPFHDLDPYYKPQGLEQFNNDPILHHLAISQQQSSSSK